MKGMFSTQSPISRRILACTLAAILCAAAIIGLAETQAASTGKHFTLESATQEVSNDPNRPSLTIKEIAKLARPSIVSVNTESTVTMGGFGNDPFGAGRRKPLNCHQPNYNLIPHSIVLPLRAVYIRAFKKKPHAAALGNIGAGPVVSPLV